MGGRIKSKAAVTATPEPGKRGSIALEIFQQVDKLMGDEKLGRTAAFTRIAEQTGRKVGAIANNYYRIARQQGVPLRARKGAARSGRPPVTASAASGLLGQLAEVIRQQEQELEKLRKENSRLAEVRKLLGS